MQILKFLFIRVLAIALVSISAIAARPTQVCSDTPTLKKQVFETALRNLLSLGYVHNAIQADAGSDVEFCTEAIVLGQNIYKYGLFLIQIEAKNKTTGHAFRKYHFLYQDASTQANHNIKFLNWTGMSSDSYQSILNQYVESNVLARKEIRGLKNPDDPIEIAQKTSFFIQSSVESSSLSALQINANTYLVTWLSSLQNSFSSTPITSGLLIRKVGADEYELNFNRFILSDLQTPLVKAVEAAELGMSQMEAADVDLTARYLQSISPAQGSDLRVLNENDQVPDAVRENTVVIWSQGRYGSGVVLGAESENPRVVTNFHVAGNLDGSTFSDQVRWKGQILKVKSKICHAYHDLCVLKLDPIQVKPLLTAQVKNLEIQKTTTLKKGQTLFYSGHRMLTPLWSKASLEHLFQMQDVKIGNTRDNGFVEGMSGGGVFTQDGKLAGIIAFKISTPNGLSYFFLPTEWVTDLMNADESALDPAIPFYAKNIKAPALYPRFVDLEFDLLAGDFAKLIPKAQKWLQDEPSHPDALYFLGQ